MFPFRHRGFDQDSPAWDLHQRAAILGYEITGRDDKDTPTSVGAWKEDTDTRGDLNCANYWQADYSQRPVGCWGFGYPSVIKSSSSGGGHDVDTRVQGQNSPKVLPIGQSGNPDTRFNPKSPLIIQPEGSAGDDPASPTAGMGGDQGPGGAGGAAGGKGGGGDGSGGDSGAQVDLGGGWVYQDGAIAYLGPAPGQVDSLSGFNQGYWGGSIGFNFSGNGFNNSLSGLTGIPGIGFSSGFAGFSGVKNFFGQGGSIGFTYRGGSR
jgi:hypothetical protein